MKIKILIITFVVIMNISIASSNDVNKNEIFKNIRCLICQGQSVADSNSDFAQTIKLVVNDLIAEGKSKNEIYSFLIEKYGEWIVYKPPFNGPNSILWIFPYLVFVIGGVMIFLLLNKREKR